MGPPPPREEREDAGQIERERERDRRQHTILIGFGRVGQLVAEGARESASALVIVEEEPDTAREAMSKGFTVVIGRATEPHVLEEAGIAEADKLIIAIPEGYEGGASAQRSRSLNSELTIFARAHSDEEVDHLLRRGADEVVMGEREIAKRFIGLIRSAGRPAAPG